MEIIQFDENIFQMGCNHLGCPCRKLCWRTGIWWICHFNIARREDCSVREGEQKDGGKTRGNPKIYGKIMWKTIDSSEAVSVYIDYMFWSDILAKPQCNLSLKGAVNVLLWQAKLWGSWQVGSWLHDKLTSNRYTYSIVFWKSQCMWKRIREACQTLYCVYFFAICSAAESNWVMCLPGRVGFFGMYASLNMCLFSSMCALTFVVPPQCCHHWLGIHKLAACWIPLNDCMDRLWSCLVLDFKKKNVLNLEKKRYQQALTM